ncbi:MAG: PrgI family protein [Patescibacteria group bacterium]|nr:PrgI family protein [Patescibacteria group bacterium]
MQQFVVPQFIDVEDKIIGPITTRQFIVMLVGFLIIGISYKIFDFSLFVTFGLVVFAISGVIAFLRINGRPFHYFILNLFQTFKRPKLRIWRHVFYQPDIEVKSSGLPTAKALAEKHYTSSRLAELSLIVDTKGAYRGEREKGGDVVERII